MDGLSSNGEVRQSHSVGAIRNRLGPRSSESFASKRADWLRFAPHAAPTKPSMGQLFLVLHES
jgi:hypothetical protein